MASKDDCRFGSGSVGAKSTRANEERPPDRQAAKTLQIWRFGSRRVRVLGSWLHLVDQSRSARQLERPKAPIRKCDACEGVGLKIGGPCVMNALLSQHTLNGQRDRWRQ